MEIEIKAVTNGIDNDLTPDRAAACAARGDYMEGSLVGATPDEAIDGYVLEDSDRVYVGEAAEALGHTSEEMLRYWDDEDANVPVFIEKEAKFRSLIPDLLRRGHFGPFEHIQFFFAVEDISRVAMAQVTRHRHMSFDVQSQRYANFGGKDPVIPPTFKETNPSHANSKDTWAKELEAHWRESVRKYDAAIEDGIPKEDARFFLPQSTPVNLTFSSNMRSLMHFFDLRNNAKAQWEARDFASRLLELVKEKAPITFEAYEEHLNNNSLRAP